MDPLYRNPHLKLHGTSTLRVNCGLFNIAMNIYGYFAPKFNHMLLFGRLWHVNTRSLISREDDSYGHGESNTWLIRE